MCRLLLSLVLLLLGAGGVSAQTALSLVPTKPGQIRVDGELSEWRGQRFVELGDAEDQSLEFALGYSKSGLFVGARVYDDEFVRSARPGSKEDSVVVSLAIPNGAGRFHLKELWIFAGIQGKQAGSAAVGSGGSLRPAAGSKVVEGPLKGGSGYVVEAFVPWKALGARDWRVSRGAVRLHDVDQKGGRATELTTARVQRKKLQLLPALVAQGGGADAYAGFLSSKGMPGAAARFDLVGNVTGGPLLERVIVVGTYAAVLGPDVQQGGGFHYADLPVVAATAVKSASLRDLTGDGRRELVVRLRQRNEQGARELWGVLGLADGPPKDLLSVEVVKETKDGKVEADLRVSAARPPTITVSAGSADGLSAANYRERPDRAVQPILLPWGKYSERAYRWDGQSFAMVDEVANKAYTPPAKAQPPKPATTGRAPAQISSSAPPGVDALIAQFRRSRGLSKSARPRFMRHTNLEGDKRPESVMLFGKELLVVGKGFRDGTGFFYFGLPVVDGSQIKHIFTADVSGDGRDEVFICFVQQIQDVERLILAAYSFQAGGFSQILAVEIGRTQGGNSISNKVDLVRKGKGKTLKVSPGKARGWTEATYPFLRESQDGYGPLLLPWADRPHTYRFRQGQLTSSD